MLRCAIMLGGSDCGSACIFLYAARSLTTFASAALKLQAALRSSTFWSGFVHGVARVRGPGRKQLYGCATAGAPRTSSAPVPAVRPDMNRPLDELIVTPLFVAGRRMAGPATRATFSAARDSRSAGAEKVSRRRRQLRSLLRRR